ncbi:MAG: V4R domain-containing protein [Conexivisphaerales archaeon]
MDNSAGHDKAQKTGRNEGVLLDSTNGRRIIMVDAESFRSADKELEGALGFGSKIVMFRRGIGYGKSLANDMKKRMNITEMLDSLAKTVSAWGLGKMTVIPHSRNTFPLKLILANCPFCSSEERSNEPVCHFLAGCIAGFFMTWSESEVKVREVACRGTGSETCDFVVESSILL